MSVLISGETGAAMDAERIRAKGGGRKSLADQYPEIPHAIGETIENTTCGNPEDPLKWTTLRLVKISEQLKERGIPAGKNAAAKMLTEPGYSCQQNQKQLQVGKPHPDRDGQFRFINAAVEPYTEAGLSATSIDTKKKERPGSFMNSYAAYRRTKDPPSCPVTIPGLRTWAILRLSVSAVSIQIQLSSTLGSAVKPMGSQ